MSKYNIHSDFKNGSTRLTLSPLVLPLINTFLTKSGIKIKPIEGVRVISKKIPSYQNGMIELTIYESKDIEENAPCLIYLHGGAFARKAAPYHMNLVCEYALKTP